MKVMKFGGTSVGSPEAITRCAELVEREIKLSGSKPVVVISAHSKVTDKLLDAAPADVSASGSGGIRRLRSRLCDRLEVYERAALAGDVRKNLLDVQAARARAGRGNWVHC